MAAEAAGSCHAVGVERNPVGVSGEQAPVAHLSHLTGVGSGTVCCPPPGARTKTLGHTSRASTRTNSRERAAPSPCRRRPRHMGTRMPKLSLRDPSSAGGVRRCDDRRSQHPRKPPTPPRALCRPIRGCVGALRGRLVRTVGGSRVPARLRVRRRVRRRHGGGGHESAGPRRRRSRGTSSRSTWRCARTGTCTPTAGATKGSPACSR